MNTKLRTQRGFTLVELLIVIGILAVLLAIVLIAINPQQKFKQANNTARRADVNAILDAISSYAADNDGQLPAGIDSTAKTITSASGTGNLNLCSALTPTYIADLPLDPTSGTETPAGSVCRGSGATYTTGYTVKSSPGNRITVAAPSAENGETISTTR